MTTFEQFKRLSGHGNVIPVHETLLADAETPVSVYLKIKDESPYSFLLESVEGGEKLGRYSFLGYNPFMRFTISEAQFEITPLHNDVVVLPSLVSATDHPLDALKKIFAHIKTVRADGLPRLTGGAVGYFGYESVGLIENVPSVEYDELKVPDVFLLFYDVVLVFDNIKHQLFLVSNGYVPENASDEELRREYDKAVEEILRLKQILKKTVSTDLGQAITDGAISFGFPKEEFKNAVERSREYIIEGDIFQVVLSQRLKQQARVAPFDLYRTLRLINPSPYMYFLNFDNFSIIGSSPEMLVRVDRGTVETRPIAGTRRRGADREEDEKLERELLADPKERAEHLMLVDLGRNDVGRISDFGTVKVEEFMVIEKYSHVMHIVSEIRGQLRKGFSQLDALFSCFPAGTLSGAPKVRAMEIIAELEPVKRCIYGGAIAYIDFSGNLDSCIAIRTIVAKDDTLYFQAGAGIVYDSKPEREYEETLEKLRANLKALEMLCPDYQKS
ncbi:MAG: anthranilate synthase component I [Bacteroidota bacterium]